MLLNTPPELHKEVPIDTRMGDVGIGVAVMDKRISKPSDYFKSPYLNRRVVISEKPSFNVEKLFSWLTRDITDVQR